jgi:hypothetical protein
MVHTGWKGDCRVRLQTKIHDKFFGELDLINTRFYFAEIPWNRDLTIRGYIEIIDEDYMACIDRAKKTLLMVLESEVVIFEKGIEMTSLSEFRDEFLNPCETSIEINMNGSGILVYLVMLVGTLIIKFSPGGSFEGAEVKSC